MVSERPLAIVGIGCHFPGAANTPEDYWALLCNGIDATRAIPESRWSAAKYSDPNPAKVGKMVIERGGFLGDIDQFDPQFFGISPREAHSLDPQQRLLLRTTWEALEDGGIPADELAGTDVGVFIGGFTLDYQLLQNHGRASRYQFKTHSAVGMMMTMLANRISYTFDFRGPSMTVDTACSSSLVAVHLAAQSIWNDECDVALAGGVNIMIAPNTAIAESRSGFLSPDGRSKAFDASADGYARGEGGAVVLIKPLESALRDGDHIYAQILGTAVSQDGHTDGITVPSEQAQQAAITAALRRAGLHPNEIDYVEAHGTGTPVGDPIEVRALATALGADRPNTRPLLIGSAKTNIGHLEAGAGVAGLVKAALAVEHAYIPPNLHLNTPNSDIPFAELNIDVPRIGRAWPQPRGRRLAGVNSFGFGGTNAHVVLSDAPEPISIAARPSGALPLTLLPLSARAEEAVGPVAGQLAEYLSARPDVTLADLGYTLSRRRSHLSHRRTLVVDSIADAQTQLQALADGSAGSAKIPAGRTSDATPKLAFVCGGMGPQWWKMCRGLLDVYPAFTESIQRTDRELRRYADWSLIEELCKDEAESRMAETDVAQPANFAIQIALAEQLRHFGIVPDAVVGHSAGEIASHYLAGVLTFEQAVQVVYHRSDLLQRTSGRGRMLAIGLSAEAVRQTVDSRLFDGSRVSIAAVNSPSAVVVAGDNDALAEIAGQLDEFEIFNRFLAVKVPYHSHYMDELRDELADALADLVPKSAEIPIYSTVTGEQLEGTAADGAYWWHNTRATVLFEAAVRRMLEDGYTHFVELGPHPVLAASIVEIAESEKTDIITLASQRRKEDDSHTLMSCVGALHCQGHPIAWDALYPQAQLLKLPRYPWQAKRYWSESQEALEDLHYNPVHPLLGQSIAGVHPMWEAELSVANVPFVADHRVQGSVLLPGAAFLEMALAAAQETYGSADFAVENLELRHAVILDDTCDPILRTTLNRETGAIEFAACTASPGGEVRWTIAATAELNTVAKPKGLHDTIETGSTIDAEVFYARTRAIGFEYGDAFHTVCSVTSGEGWAVGQLTTPAPIAHELDSYRFHPALIDGALQTLLGTPFPGKDTGENTYLPTRIRRSTIYGAPEQEMTAHVRVLSYSNAEIESDITIANAAGEPLVALEGFKVQSLDSSSSMSAERVDKGLLEIRWVAHEWEPQDEPAAESSSWLVFVDDSGVGEAVGEELRRRGHRVRTVAHRPDEPEGFAELLAAHVEAEGGLAGIVDCWPLDITEPGDRAGVLSVLHLVKALAQREDVAPRLYLLTANAQPVADTDTIAVDQAPVWGLGRVVGHQELTHQWGGLIDIDSADDRVVTAARVTEQILGDDVEDQLAIRGGKAYVPRLRAITGLTKAFPTKLTRDATYVVTGGSGALGRVVALYLAERGARHIAMLSRTEFPPRARWADVATDDPRHATISAIRKAEQLGAQISTASVDVTDANQVRNWVDRHIRDCGRPIRGIIHTAGVVDDQLLVNMSEAAFERVLAPKVAGARALHDALDGHDLEFFVMFGSAGSVISAPGQGNYAAANAYLDAFAHYRQSLGLPALTIGWGPWSVGMAEELNLHRVYAQRGIELITPAAGGQILDRIINQQAPNVIAISADWKRARSLGFGGQVPPMFSELGKADAAADDSESGSSILDLLAITPEDDRLGVVVSHVQQLVAGVFDLPEVGADETLNELGLDSMMAIELKARIGAVLSIDLPVLELLKGVNVNSLAERIFTELQSAKAGSAVTAEEESAVAGDDVDRLLEQLSVSELRELLADLES